MPKEFEGKVVVVSGGTPGVLLSSILQSLVTDCRKR